jgi:[ribosomal protein S5]-alanine N-acetyltransferase
MSLKNNVFLETERLYVRPWEEWDLHNSVDDFYSIMNQRKLHEFTGEEPWTKAQTAEVISWCISNIDLNSSYFNCPLILRETGKIFGRVGLNPYHEEKRIPEIEWTIGCPHWGKGYASEIGAAMLKFPFERAGFESLFGITHPGNIGSIKVMEKQQMKREGLREFRGEQWLFYSISNSISL